MIKYFYLSLIVICSCNIFETETNQEFIIKDASRNHNCPLSQIAVIKADDFNLIYKLKVCGIERTYRINVE